MSMLGPPEIPGSLRLGDVGEVGLQQQADTTGDSKAQSLAQGVSHPDMSWMPWHQNMVLFSGEMVIIPLFRDLFFGCGIERNTVYPWHIWDIWD